MRIKLLHQAAPSKQGTGASCTSFFTRRKTRRRQRIILCRLVLWQESVLEVTYELTPEDAWRSNLYLLWHQPRAWTHFLIAPVLWTWFCYWQFVPLQHSLYLHSGHGWWLPAVFLFYFCLFSFCIIGGTSSKINKCYPEAICEPITATTLTPEWLHDSRRKYEGNKTIIVMPMTVAWKDI